MTTAPPRAFAYGAAHGWWALAAAAIAAAAAAFADRSASPSPSAPSPSSWRLAVALYGVSVLDRHGPHPALASTSSHVAQLALSVAWTLCGRRPCWAPGSYRATHLTLVLRAERHWRSSASRQR